MHAELETVRTAIERATVGMNSNELAWHPEGKWSSAEVLEHLALTYSGTVKGLRAALQSNAPSVRPATWKERFSAQLVVGVGYFPSGREAPRQVRPRESDPQQILDKIQANLSELDQALEECEQRFGGKAVVLVHPVLGPISLHEWRKFHRVHCLHHMKQIRLLRSRMQQATPQAAAL
jgi:hypothetical protein